MNNKINESCFKFKKRDNINFGPFVGVSASSVKLSPELTGNKVS